MSADSVGGAKGPRVGGSARKKSPRSASTEGHDLRRTYATRAASGGYPMSTLKDVLRHSSMETTSAYYVHTNCAERARLLAALDLGTAPPSSGTQKAHSRATPARTGGQRYLEWGANR